MAEQPLSVPHRHQQKPQTQQQCQIERYKNNVEDRPGTVAVCLIDDPSVYFYPHHQQNDDCHDHRQRLNFHTPSLWLSVIVIQMPDEWLPGSCSGIPPKSPRPSQTCRPPDAGMTPDASPPPRRPGWLNPACSPAACCGGLKWLNLQGDLAYALDIPPGTRVSVCVSCILNREPLTPVVTILASNPD